MIEYIVHAVADASAALGNAAVGKLEVEFVTEDPPDRVPDLVEGKLILASPWLSGIPVEGTWDREYLDEAQFQRFQNAPGVQHASHTCKGQGSRPGQ